MSYTEPMDVTHRHRFKIFHSQITIIENEYFTDLLENESASGMFTSETEQPCTGMMRDIVSTIQLEQGEIRTRRSRHRHLRARRARHCKTAIDLHHAPGYFTLVESASIAHMCW